MKPNKKTREYYQRLVSLGCIVCRLQYGVHSDPCIHHVRTKGLGMGQKSKDALPLCWEHHQGRDGVHTNTKKWEEKYGTQEELLEIVNDLLND
jgi:hypothetical protein|tara:strand:- start:4097 stop:4375 length:279 start_codon:yes stop_codon:yes gene_type:complete